MNNWQRPSFLGFFLNGILLAIFFIYFINNYKSLSSKDMIHLSLVASIAIGVHSMLHDREERLYGYNPLMNL
jgi:hypothetical protein